MFVCTNQKAPGKKCCANSGGAQSFAYLKEKLLERELFGPGKIRVSQSGCLGRCSSGPCLVIYPESVWYTYSSLEDMDQIIESHLVDEQIVESLFME